MVPGLGKGRDGGADAPGSGHLDRPPFPGQHHLPGGTPSSPQRMPRLERAAPLGAPGARCPSGSSPGPWPASGPGEKRSGSVPACWTCRIFPGQPPRPWAPCTSVTGWTGMPAGMRFPFRRARKEFWFFLPAGRFPLPGKSCIMSNCQEGPAGLPLRQQKRAE